jgi:ankyrin repeat protein
VLQTLLIPIIFLGSVILNEPASHQLASPAIVSGTHQSRVTPQRCSNVEQVEQIINNSSPELLNFVDRDTKHPPLYAAVLVEGDERSEGLIKVLLRYGADIRYKDNMDQTALFYACRDGIPIDMQARIAVSNFYSARV